MAIAFKNAHGEAAASSTVVYTAPAATESTVFTVDLANIDGTNSVTASIEVTDTSAGTTKTILDALSIPINDTFTLNGKIVLEATDTLRIFAGATGDVDYHLAIMEKS